MKAKKILIIQLIVIWSLTILAIEIANLMKQVNEMPVVMKNTETDKIK